MPPKTPKSTIKPADFASLYEGFNAPVSRFDCGRKCAPLNGGEPASPLQPSGTNGPVLLADLLAGQNMTQAARNVLQRLDSILAENSEGMKKTVAGLSAFSDALGRNSDRVDGIIAGLERMTAGSNTSSGALYDLVAPRTFR